jgi:hypothetical protein
LAGPSSQSLLSTQRVKFAKYILHADFYNGRLFLRGAGGRYVILDRRRHT